MTAVVQVLIGASIGLSMWFVLDLGHPRGHVGWMLAAWGWVTVAFETMLLLATFRVHVPAWAAVVVLLAQDAVFTWRLVLLRRSRRNRPESLIDTTDQESL